ncbi:hypothetical protein ACFSRY_01120 [Pontibacter locisalis]|uniref:Uncharacterized protein n=1 Tax=Pontibacter locisalis TaxID=1719035 RepID=A0ABW5IH38_9BACT
MAENVTQALDDFEKFVKEGKIDLFWVTVHSNRLRIKAAHSPIERIVPLGKDLCESLAAFFQEIERIEYRTHDYVSLKSFINARTMLDKMLGEKVSE